VILGALTRHASAGTKNTLSAAQAALNVVGIIETDATRVVRKVTFCDPANPSPNCKP
jgi:hypothetical protein